MPMPGDVVELADTLDLGSSAERRGGSTPSIPTNFVKIKFMKDEDLMKLSEHFFEKCPTEARNFFNQILTKLDEIEKKLDDLESR